MPKVDQTYFENKENQIIDAAIRVCKSKPAYSVTMKDVIRECGISQGGIYRYFSDIDEIFAVILNRYYDEISFDEEITKIFESNNEPSEIIHEAFKLLGKMIDNTITRFGNFVYELNAIYLNDNVRGEKAQSLVRVNNTNEKIFDNLLRYIDKHTANGNFRPKIPKEHVMILIASHVEGIFKLLTFTGNTDGLQAKYGISKEDTTAQGMMEILFRAVDALLEKR